MTPPPARIGRYEIVERLGKGAMGAVYLARDPVVGGEVAVKLLAAEIDDPQQLRRFEARVRQVAALDHRNIVRVFDWGEHEGRPFLAMEYLPGETLADLIHRGAPMPLASKIELINGVCKGLGHAHAAGVVHRRLSPPNVIIGVDGTPKILDFPIVAVSSWEDARILSSTYAAPEQIQGSPVDLRADIFAAGAMLYELIALRPAFAGTTPAELFAQVLHGEPVPLKTVVPDLDPALQRIVDRALSKTVEDRYQTAAEMRADLQGLQPPAVPSLSDSFDPFSEIRLPGAGGPPRPPLRPRPAPVASDTPDDDDESPTMSMPAPTSARVPAAKASRSPDRIGEPLDTRRASAPLPAPVALARPTLFSRLADAVRSAAALLGAGMRSRRSEDRTDTQPEPVLFGASAPRAVAAGSTFTARFSAYIQAREREVATQLHQLSGGAAQSIVGLRPERGGRWKIGTPVTVRVTGGPFVADPAERSFEWNGSESIVTFFVRVAGDAAGRAPLELEVFIEGLSVAVVVMDLRISAEVAPEEPLRVTARAPSTAFASYSAKDAALVALCLSTIQRWDPGLDVFMDCLDLTPNQKWQSELERLIPEKEMFLLFWSANAMRSRWVQWEIDVRRTSKGIDSIRPMPLDDPAIAPPPPELSHLHFRDRFMIARQGFLRLNEQAPH